MTNNNNIQWERHTGGNSATWHLREYRQSKSHGAYSVSIGTARKVKNKHRCRMWVVQYTGDFFNDHLATLKDMKQPEALDAARLLIMMRHNDETRNR